MPLSPTSIPTYSKTYYNKTSFVGSSTYGEKVDGSDGNDFIYTLGQDDYIDGDYGNDTLWGGTGDDIVYGNTGNDTLSGDAGDDWLYGDRGSESRWANGNDYVVGGAGNDYIFGAGGDDELIGGADNDTIEGGTGDDLLVGGTGADVFRFDVAAETTTSALVSYDRDIISDFEDGTDLITLIGVTADDVDVNPSSNGNGYAEITVHGTAGDLIIELTGIDPSLVDPLIDFIYL